MPEIKQLQIFSPDGQTRFVPLSAERISLGRATTVDLSFPEDARLSRQHLAIERDGNDWMLLDLGSKNGTLLNGVTVSSRMKLNSGDRISAGRLVIVYDAATPPKPLVVFDPSRHTGQEDPSKTVLTRLDGVIASDGSVVDPQLLAASHVSALIRAGNELAGNRPLPELFRFILELAIQTVQADRGVLMTIEGDELVVRAHKGQGFRISTAVRDRVLNGRHSVLVHDMADDDTLRERQSIVEQQIRTLIAVPLQTQDDVIGIIYVDSPSLRRQFTKDDLNLLTVMANVAAIRIEHTRFAEAEHARQILERDLEQASEIQQAILPAGAPVIDGLDIAGHNAPCRTVGGDYYDFSLQSSHQITMVLGDVAGKGMPASLLMMGLQARVQVLIEQPGSLGDVMTRLNRITAANCPPDRFITLFICSLDSETGDLTFCNAGHNPPLLIRVDGSTDLLKGSGPVIGPLPDVEYLQSRDRLEHGDLLVIYSDGVTETCDAEGKDFDVGGLSSIVTACRDEDSGEIIRRVLESLATYRAGAAQSDDITLVIAKRL